MIIFNSSYANISQMNLLPFLSIFASLCSPSRPICGAQIFLYMWPSTREWLIYLDYSLGKNWLYHFQPRRIANSLLAKGRILYPVFIPSMLRFGLACAFTSFVHVMIMILSSYVQLPCWIQKTLVFFHSHLQPLTLLYFVLMSLLEEAVGWIMSSTSTVGIILLEVIGGKSIND